MEMKVREQELFVPAMLLDTFDEKPVDCDFVLPDYCPEMAAVLKCTLEPAIGGSQWSGDRLMVDGQVWIRVLYLDEKRTCVYSYEGSQPFTSAFSIAGRTEQTAVQLSVKSDYVNCRATGPRRLEVHGSFRVVAQVMGETACSVLQEIQEQTVFTQKERILCSLPAATASKPFSVNEVLETERRSPLVRLVRYEAVPVVSDCKILLGKLILKGELHIKTLYVCDEESGRTDTVTHEIPFSQMMDIEGLNEEWTVDPDVCVAASDMRIGEEEGMGRAMVFSAKLTATAVCWRTEAVEILTDAYSTQFPLHTQRRPLTARRLQGLYRQSTVVKQALELPNDQIVGVQDVWCEATVMNTHQEEGRQWIDARLQVCLLCFDAEGLISYYERPADLRFDLPAESGEETDTLEVRHTDYTVSADKKLELRVELAVKRTCYETQVFSPIDKVSGEENECFPPETAAIKVVFAHAGESLWGIARDCRTSVDAVMQENDLTADVLAQDTMLIVPMC